MIWDKWRLKGLSSLENLFSYTLLGNAVLIRWGSSVPDGQQLQSASLALEDLPCPSLHKQPFDLNGHLCNASFPQWWHCRECEHLKLNTGGPIG